MSAILDIITKTIACYNSTVKVLSDSEELKNCLESIMEVEQTKNNENPCGFDCYGCGNCEHVSNPYAYAPSSAWTNRPKNISFEPCAYCYNCGKCESLANIEFEDY